MTEHDIVTLVMTRAEYEAMLEIFTMLLIFAAAQAERHPELRTRFEEIDRWCENLERSAGGAPD